MYDIHSSIRKIDARPDDIQLVAWHFSNFDICIIEINQLFIYYEKKSIGSLDAVSEKNCFIVIGLLGLYGH